MYFPGRRLLCIIGRFKDKEYDKIARIMGPLASVIYPVALPDQQRGLPPEKLAETLKMYCPCVKAPDKNMHGKAGKFLLRTARAGQRENQDSDGTGSTGRYGGTGRTGGAEGSRKRRCNSCFGSLSYLNQIKEAYDRAVCKKRDGEMIDQKKIEEAVKLFLEGIGKIFPEKG